MTGFIFDYDRLAIEFDEAMPSHEGDYGTIYEGCVVTVSLDEIRRLRDRATGTIYDADDAAFAQWRDEQGFIDPPAETYIEEQEVAEDAWWAERYTDHDQRVAAAVRTEALQLWPTEVACGCSKGRSGHLHWMHRDEDGNASCSKGYGSVVGWRVWTLDELVAAVLAGEFAQVAATDFASNRITSV